MKSGSLTYICGAEPMHVLDGVQPFTDSSQQTKADKPARVSKCMQGNMAGQPRRVRWALIQEI